MRMFPIQSSGVSGELLEIPWVLMQQHEFQALRNHCGQTLDRLAERCGLSACEAVAVLEDKNYRDRWIGCPTTQEERIKMATEANNQLRAIVEKYFKT